VGYGKILGQESGSGFRVVILCEIQTNTNTRYLQIGKKTDSVKKNADMLGRLSLLSCLILVYP
jgi:hypothetical protein